ncbi:MAG: DUF1194 domain-containing protein [Pseudomonadota bacterium]
MRLHPRRLLIAAALALAMIGQSGMAQAQSGAETPCRLALILALDISHSVDQEEQKLQTGGLAAALLDEEVKAAILSPGGGVAALAFEWSGLRRQHTVAHWTLLDSEDAIEAFAARIAARPVSTWGHPTALGRALAHSAWLHTQNPWDCDTKVVDVSGDGVNNEGLGPLHYRAKGVLEGLIINGLVIRNNDPDPLPQYIEEVLHGPGAFVIDIRSYGDYLTAMKEKLIRELSPFVAAAPSPTVVE